MDSKYYSNERFCDCGDSPFEALPRVSIEVCHASVRYSFEAKSVAVAPLPDRRSLLLHSEHPSVEAIGHLLRREQHQCDDRLLYYDQTTYASLSASHTAQILDSFETTTSLHQRITLKVPNTHDALLTKCEMYDTNNIRKALRGLSA